MEHFWDTVDTIGEDFGFSLFGARHLVTLALYIGFAALSCKLYKAADEKKRAQLRGLFAVLLLADEAFKQIGLQIGGNFNWDYLPLHLCLINIFLIALYAWKPSRLLDNFLYFICIPAATAALLFPTWTSLPAANFMFWHSTSVHILLAAYPIMLFSGGDIRPSVRYMGKCFLLLPLCPVYGLGALAVFSLPPALTGTFWTMALWGGLAATAVEYAVHLLYDRLLGVRFWDYSQVRWNLRGRVCLPFSLVWGLLTAAALPPLQGALMPWLSALPVWLTYALLLVTTADGVISAALLRQTGSLIEAPSGYLHLTARENLSIVADLKDVGRKDISRVLEIVHLTKDADRKVGQYSLGMKQRLGIAMALLGSPKLLILDEPTNGLDPAGIQEMRSLIASMPQTTGATVLISSHLLGEIEQMVDQVGILNHGKLLFEGSLQQLQKHSRGGILLRVLDAPKAAAVLQQQGVKAAAPADQPDTLQLPPLPDEALAALVCTLAESGVGVVGLTAQTKSLEDIFLSLTQTSGEVA